MPEENQGSKKGLKKAHAARVKNKPALLALQKSPFGRRIVELRKHLNTNGYKVNSTNYKTGCFSLKPPKVGASEQETSNWIAAAITMAESLGFKVVKRKVLGIELNEPKLSKKQVAKPESTGTTATATTTSKKARKEQKGVHISKVRIANQSTGGMKNHVTLSGAAFMGILQGVSPQRLTEAVLVFMRKLTPQSRKAFAQKIAEAGGATIPVVAAQPTITKEDLKLLKKVKKLGIKLG